MQFNEVDSLQLSEAILGKTRNVLIHKKVVKMITC